jgi:hypothetical protein
MKFWKLAKKNNAVAEVYESEIIRRIRKRYSVDQELSLHRQRFEKPAEFEEYYAFVENCKAAVKAEMEG